VTTPTSSTPAAELNFYLRGALIGYDEAAQRRIIEGATEYIAAIESEAAGAAAETGGLPFRATFDEAMTLLRMANPRMAIGGAAADAWLGEVAAFLREHPGLSVHPDREDAPDGGGAT
jgi:hypothetical protein